MPIRYRRDIDVAVAQGCAHLIFTVGGRGESFVQRLFALPEIAFVQIGDFSVRRCAMPPRPGRRKCLWHR